MIPSSYLFFSAWLISLSIMPSRSVHILRNGRISFFLWLSVCVCVSPIFFVYSCIDGQFSCFHVLAGVNNATVKLGMQIRKDSNFIPFRLSQK